jgi:hypothetical protein
MLSLPVLNMGNVTGIVGAVTGPAGCVIGWISYRRSQQIKKLDLRLELRKQMSGVRAEIEALPVLLEKAKASRSAVRAAMGRGQQSGDNLIWKDELEGDLKTAQALAGELPDPVETYRHSKPRELEDKLVDVDVLAAKAAQLRNKYQAALARDDEDRDYIRANADRRFGP